MKKIYSSLIQFTYRDAAGFNKSFTFFVASNLNIFFLQKSFSKPREVPALTVEFENLGYKTDKTMRAVMQPCNKMLKKCYWLSKEVSCEELFHLSKSSGGYCCSFNYKGIEDKK